MEYEVKAKRKIKFAWYCVSKQCCEYEIMVKGRNLPAKKYRTKIFKSETKVLNCDKCGSELLMLKSTGKRG